MVQKGDGAESRASRDWPVAVTGRARRSTKQPLYSRDEDPREGRDCVGPVSEKAAQPLRDGDHPLPYGHRGNDAVHEMRSCLCHPAAIARGTAAAAHAPDETAVAETPAETAPAGVDPATRPAPPLKHSICPTFHPIDGVEEHPAECERLHGPQSPKTADAILSVAAQWYENGEVAKADPVFRRAVETYDAAYGQNSTKTALCMLVYADFLIQEGRPREAVPLLKRSFEIHQEASGPDHPETLLVIRMLAEAVEQLGQKKATKRALKRERMSRNQILPRVAPTASDDPDYFRAHEHVGSRLFARGNYEAADYHFRRAVQLRPDLGENHNNLGTILSVRAQMLAQRGDQAGAEFELNAAIKQFAKAKKLSPDVPSIACNLANALAAAERFNDAVDIFRELIANEPNNAALLTNYGVLLYKQGKNKESLVQLRRAVELAPDLKEAKESLAVVLGEVNAPNPAIPPEGQLQFNALPPSATLRPALLP